MLCLLFFHDLEKNSLAKLSRNPPEIRCSYRALLFLWSKKQFKSNDYNTIWGRQGWCVCLFVCLFEGAWGKTARRWQTHSERLLDLFRGMRGVSKPGKRTAAKGAHKEQKQYIHINKNHFLTLTVALKQQTAAFVGYILLRHKTCTQKLYEEEQCYKIK